ncbi:FecR domain-containing protein [Pararhodospirillum photometricum]|uniref:Peptidase M10A and M12B, matrixin and adamalysin n=1 Tax=Pararhodospirillum photometricum DSM 122 TaxID=1150469 RepID=H6SQV2_PARPM|nr:FecR domain-containing protein [Pararhodospirillum photometricum]CCG07417.1 Peptidase M10A and M12B, matrixin and adamalysin [Pararhodospirillum photometricum DSM 122]
MTIVTQNARPDQATDTGLSPWSDGGAGLTILSLDGSSPVIGDSGLLLHGIYSRDGADLLIVDGQGHGVIVTDYFLKDPPPALVSAEGARLEGDVVARLAGSATPGQVAQAGPASGTSVPIGTIEKVTGAVVITRADGTRIEPRAGDPVFEDDVVETKGDGAIGIKFMDGSAFSLTGNGRMVLDELVYDPASGQGHSSVDLVAGVFSFVSGGIARSGPDAMTLVTPVATIGVRGTMGVIKIIVPEGVDLGDMDAVRARLGALGVSLDVVLLPEADGTTGEIIFTPMGGEPQVLNVAYDGLRVTVGQILDRVETSVARFTASPDDFRGEGAAGRSLDFLPADPSKSQDDQGGKTNAPAQPDGKPQGQGDTGTDKSDANTGQDTQQAQNTGQETGASQTQGQPLVYRPLDLDLSGTAAETLQGSAQDDAISGGSTTTGSTTSAGSATRPSAVVSFADTIARTIVTQTTTDATTTLTSSPSPTLSGSGSSASGTGSSGGSEAPAGSSGPGSPDTGSGTGGTGTGSTGSGSGSTGSGSGSTGSGSGGTDTGTGSGGTTVQKVLQASPDTPMPTFVVSASSSDWYKNWDVTGSTASDSIETGAGNDTLVGGAGGDILKSNDGDDVMIGGSGADSLIAGSGNGDDTYSGGNGLSDDDDDNLDDWILFPSTGQGIRVDLASGVASGSEIGTDRLYALEHVLGGSGNDTLIGNADDNILQGGVGNDQLSGGAGNDSLEGGAGNDTMQGGRGNDTLVGGDGTDWADYSDATNPVVLSLSAGTAGGLDVGVDVLSGIENVIGGAGNDTLTGDNAANALQGGAGSDSLVGLGGNDTLDLGIGGGLIDAGAGDDDGRFTLTAGAEVTVAGGAGTDTLVITVTDADLEDTDRLAALAQVRAFVEAHPGESTSFSALGLTLEGWESVRIVDSAGAEVDLDGVVTSPALTLVSTSGAEDTALGLRLAVSATSSVTQTLTVTLSGIPEGAVLRDASGAELVQTDHAVTLSADQLAGLTLTPPAQSAADIQLQVEATATALDGSTATSTGTLTLVVTPVVDGVTFDLPEADTLVTPHASDDVLEGGDGSSTMQGGGGNDTLTGGSSDDLLLGDEETGWFSEKLDLTPLLVDGDGSEDVTVRLQGLPETALLSAGTRQSDGSWLLSAADLPGLTVTMPTGATSFVLTLSATVVDLDPDDGTSVSATQTWTSHITVDPGVAGNDVLQGGSGTDTLIGGAGEDTLDGGIGADVVMGGTGNDLGIFSRDATASGADTYDGGLGTDTLRVVLSASDLANRAVMQDLERLRDFVAAQADATSEAGEAASFSALGLTVRNWEAVSFVDANGTPLVIDSGPEAGTLTFTVAEDGVASTGATASALLPHDGGYDAVGARLSLTGLSTSLTSGGESVVVTSDGAGGLIGRVGTATVFTLALETTTGVVTYTQHLPLDHPTGDDLPLVVAYRVTDGDGSTADGTLNVVVHDDTPEAQDDSQSITVGTTPQTVSGSLVENDLLGADGLGRITEIRLNGTVHTAGADGTVTIATAGGAQVWVDFATGAYSVTVTPGAGATDATVELGYSLVDGDGDTTSATLTLTLDQPEAQPPTLTGGPVTGLEDGTLALSLAAALADTDGAETLALTIAGLPAGATLSAGTRNADGTWSLTPAQLTGLTLTPPADSDAGFTLIVTATATETSNGTTQSTQIEVPVTLTAVADTPVVTVSDVSGTEDGAAIPLVVTASTPDTDGSETLSLIFTGVPQGVTLSAGTYDPTTQAWTLTPAQVVGLTLTTPAQYSGSFDITVTARTTESATGTSAEASDTFSVSVAPVADPVSLVITAAQGDEDTAIPLAITATTPDADGSETLSVTITGVPSGASLSAGIYTPANNTWTLTTAQLSGLTLTPPPDYAGSITLTVTARTTEDATGAFAEASKTLGVTVLPVADTATLTDAQVYESEDVVDGRTDDEITASGGTNFYAGFGGNDTLIAGNDSVTIFGDYYGLDIVVILDLSATAGDTDGSETMTYTLAGLPEGVTVTDSEGTALTITSGTVTLSEWQLEGLRLCTPVTQDTFSLTFQATITDQSATGATDTGTTSHTVTIVMGGDDLLVGGTHDETLSGGAGNDTLIGGTSNDVLYGDSGNDQIQVKLFAGYKNVQGGAGDDTLTIDISTVDMNDIEIIQNLISLRSLINGGHVGDDQALEAAGLRVTGIEHVSFVDATGAELSFLALTCQEGETVTMNLLSYLTGQAAGRSLVSVSFTVPEGYTFLVDGTEVTLDGDRGVSLTPTQLAGLSVKTPNDNATDQWIPVTAVWDNSTTTELSYGIIVTPVPETPVWTGSDTFNVIVNDEAQTLTTDEWEASLNGGGGSDTLTGDAADNLLIGDDQRLNVFVTLPLTTGEAAAADAAGTTDDASEGITSIKISGIPEGVWILPSFSLPLTVTDGSVTLTQDPTSHLVPLQLAFSLPLDQASFTLELEITVADTDPNNSSFVVSHTFTTTCEVATLSAPGDDSLIGNGGDDSLVGGEGSDTLVGGTGDDVLQGGAGADSLLGNDGDDTLAPGAGLNNVEGGGGTDWIDFSDQTADVTLSLTGTQIATTSNGGITFVAGIENIQGGAGADSLGGDTGDNHLAGGAGNDTLSGGGGLDTLSGGTGDDRFLLTLADTQGPTAVTSPLTWVASEATTSTWLGNEATDGQNGATDVARYSLKLYAANSDGTQKTDANEGFLKVYGTDSGSDYAGSVVSRDTGDDGDAVWVLADAQGRAFSLVSLTVTYPAGEDQPVLVQGYLNGVLVAQSSLILVAGAATTLAYGDQLNDPAFQNVDEVWILGQGANLQIGINDVVVTSHVGESVIGADAAWQGSSETDLIVLSEAGTYDLSKVVDVHASALIDGVALGSHTTLDLSGGAETLADTTTAWWMTPFGETLWVTASGSTDMTVSGLDDWIQNGWTVSYAGTLTRDDGDLAGTYHSFALTNSSLGSDYAYTVNVEDAISVVNSSGNDFVTYTDAAYAPLTLAGTEDADTLIGSGVGDTLTGDEGNDLLEGGRGADSLVGGTGDDTLLGGAGDDILDAGEGADLLRGGAGNDLLSGGLDSDADSLEGGTGDDTFAGAFSANAVYKGGEGFDWLHFSSPTTGLVLDLSNSSQFENIEGIHGDSGNDDFRASDSSSGVWMIGGGGNDTFFGSWGDDTLDGREGSCSMYGAFGDDVILASFDNGWESLEGGEGRDLLQLEGSKADLTGADLEHLSAFEGLDLSQVSGLTSLSLTSGDLSGLYGGESDPFDVSLILDPAAQVDVILSYEYQSWEFTGTKTQDLDNNGVAESYSVYAATVGSDTYTLSVSGAASVTLNNYGGC